LWFIFDATLDPRLGRSFLQGGRALSCLSVARGLSRPPGVAACPAAPEAEAEEMSAMREARRARASRFRRLGTLKIMTTWFRLAREIPGPDLGSRPCPLPPRLHQASLLRV
jgi:hypothetical protein